MPSGIDELSTTNALRVVARSPILLLLFASVGAAKLCLVDRLIDHVLRSVGDLPPRRCRYSFISN